MAISKIMWDTYWNRYRREYPDGKAWKTDQLPDLAKNAYALFDVMIEEFENESLLETAEIFRRMKKEFYETWKKEIEA